MGDMKNIIQQVVQILSQLESPQDEYSESAPSGGEVPIWSKLDAGTLGQGKGAIHDKSALMQGRQYLNPPQVQNYTDEWGLPVAGQQEEMMSAMGMV